MFLTQRQTSRRAGRILIACLVICAAIAPLARAEIKLPRLLGDHMVLQRDTPIRLWGWADPGETVTVALAKDTAKTVADARGQWSVELPARPAGGPFDLNFSGKNEVTVKDVLLGEVWVCAGQSNMEWIVTKSNNDAVEKAAANFDRIRLFTVPKAEPADPAPDIKADWHVCSPRSIGYFSAVAYFFGRDIHQKLDVPVGLIVSAVGGTRIENWTPGVGVAAVPQLKEKDRAVDGDLYKGMIHPLQPLAIRGVIWYQGEGNVGDKMLYRDRMEALIRGYRLVWKNEEMPFYYVQVAPLNWGGKSKDELPLLWEAQTAALDIPHTGMAVTNDIGNTGDAHPRNKQDVGKRLAIIARARTYGEKDLRDSGPLYRALKIEGAAIRLEFNSAENGLLSRDGKPLTWFTISGKDRKFFPAEAKIDGSTIVVSSPKVLEPAAVRFGWHQIAEPNLMNHEGLPASTFRTDDWKDMP